MVTGPRQSGKTTLLKHLFSKSHNYVTLDDPEAQLEAREDPKLFLKNNPPPLIIDEIQYAPGLLPFLKVHIDEHRSNRGDFLLTGSQVFPLMAGVSESLAGRIALFSLLSFSLQEEFRNQSDLQLGQLKKRILRGGYPELVVQEKMNSKLWHTGYLQTYLERDVRQLKKIGDLTDFQRFLRLLAAFNGQVLNLSALSRDLGVAVNTIKNWVSILEASHQVTLVQPYYRNKGKRIIKSPKIYFSDTGFVCYLNGITSVEQVFKGPQAGPLLETLVLNEIVRDFHGRGEIPQVYWWRTSAGEEVDFVVEVAGALIPIEVKLAAKQNHGMIKGMTAFSRLFENEVKAGYLVNLSDKPHALAENIVALPIFEMARRSLLDTSTA
ncbi:MAG: ATP-binding protein [Candidatus Omnitrophica bacterium]|nr:ATP-binding protein [Candidatus Omnitrophota bacterium]